MMYRVNIQLLPLHYEMLEQMGMQCPKVIPTYRCY